MARRLSDPEYVAFLNDIDVEALNLPPWGGVVQWEGLEVLVFCPGPAVESSWLWPTSRGECTEYQLTDITDVRPLVESYPSWQYNPMQNTAVWHLPEETAATIEQRLQQVSNAAGFTFENLGMIIALAIGAFVFLELRRPT